MITSPSLSDKRSSGSFLREEKSKDKNERGVEEVVTKILKITPQKNTSPAIKLTKEVTKLQGNTPPNELNIYPSIECMDSESSESTDLQSIGEFSLSDRYHRVKKPDPKNLQEVKKYFDYQSENYMTAINHLLLELRKRFDEHIKKYPDLKSYDEIGKRELEELTNDKINVLKVLRHSLGISDRCLVRKKEDVNIYANYITVEIEKHKEIFDEINGCLVQKILINLHDLFHKENLNKLKKFQIEFTRQKQILKNPFKKRKDDNYLDELSGIIKGLDDYKNQLEGYSAYLRGIIKELPLGFKEIDDEINKKLTSVNLNRDVGRIQIGTALIESYFPSLRKKVASLQDEYIEKHDNLHENRPYSYKKFFPKMKYDFDHNMPTADTPLAAAEILIRDYMRLINSGCFSMRNAQTNEVLTHFILTEEMKKDDGLLFEERAKHIAGLYAGASRWYFNDPTLFIHFNEAITQEALKDAEKQQKKHPLMSKGNADVLEIHAYNFAFLTELEKDPKKQEKVFKSIAEYLALPNKNQKTMQLGIYSVKEFAYEINHYSRAPAQGNLKTNIASLVALDNAFYNYKTLRDVKIQGTDIPDYSVREVVATVYPGEKTVFDFVQECTLGNFDRKRVSVQYHLVYEVPAYGKKMMQDESRLEYYVIRPEKLSVEEEFEFDRYYRQLENLLERSHFPTTDHKKVVVRVQYT